MIARAMNRFGIPAAGSGVALPVVLLLLAIGCSGKGTGPQTTAAADLAAGWSAFEAGQYTRARSHFLSAINKDGSLADAYSGLGWSHALLDSLGSAAIAFQNGLNRDADLTDAHAGFAVVSRDLSGNQSDLDQAIASAQAVITADAGWRFSHMTSVDYLDMHLIMAQSYYRKGGSSFSDAQAQVDILESELGLGSGPDPADPGTWVVAGVTYATYAEALLMRIEEIASMVDP